MQMKLWTRPSNYFGAEWPDYYVFLSHNRDSDAQTNSNFDRGLAAVKAVTNTDCVLVYENHWAVGWVEWIAIHKSDTAAVECAKRILERLEDYPVLDEDDWSRREDEEAQRVWKDCYDYKERADYIRKHRAQFGFCSLSDMLGCVRGRYFSGYAGELIG